MWSAPPIFRWMTTAFLGLQGTAVSQDLDGVGCQFHAVTVLAAREQDIADICRGAGDAIDFFRANGLKTAIPVRIHVRDILPTGVGLDAAGCFLEREGAVAMRPYARFREYGTWFEVRIDRRMYRSLAAHEVAHALAEGNFTIPDPGIQAKEYIAYVTMFATMDDELRARILDANRSPGVGDAGRLTALLYMFDPMRFGIAAYRHYLDLDDGHIYLGAVLAGLALAH